MNTATKVQRKKTHKARERKTLALFLVGAGLLIIGTAAWLLLPKPDQNGGSVAGESFLGPAKVNYHAPDLSLTDLKGNRVSLKDYQGNVILVNNWATWCPPCREEMPVLQAYYASHQDRGFVLIGIEAGEPAVQVSSFVDSYKITFPVWLDPENKALQAFRNDALPSSYIIDRKGTVRLMWAGMVSQAMLEKYVNPLMDE